MTIQTCYSTLTPSGDSTGNRRRKTLMSVKVVRGRDGVVGRYKVWVPPPPLTGYLCSCLRVEVKVVLFTFDSMGKVDELSIFNISLQGMTTLLQFSPVKGVTTTPMSGRTVRLSLEGQEQF